MTAIFSIVVLALAGVAYGVRLDAAQWLTMLGLLLVGLIPFVLMGIALGHLISVDSLGPALGWRDVAVRPARRGVRSVGQLRRLCLRS